MNEEELDEHQKYMEEVRNSYKVPFSCPGCSSVMYNWDTKFFYKSGTCSNCYINYIEDRNIKDEILKNRDLLYGYIKEKIKEKNKK